MRPQSDNLLVKIVFFSVTFIFSLAIFAHLILLFLIGLGIAEMNERAIGALVSIALALIHLMRKLIAVIGRENSNGT
ncbi:TPA: hypothetical protein JG919_004888 [Enterobacter hormaechei subsp. steigerwaltii]|uniref:hypothetical protein n=1 Tax=Enterobacter hormaechei TaxID=158836 RepID=UPI0034CFCD30|nr:hypothetical protein [Enterobacter hormaechei subsp. steigerwaltii]HAV1841564.1 hypothetical protein [Enterobacter hormaechei subsp. steigerwaltii]